MPNLFSLPEGAVFQIGNGTFKILRQTEKAVTYQVQGANRFRIIQKSNQNNNFQVWTQQ